MRHHTTTAALLVLLCGCTGKETEPAANSRQITASSRMDATADVVDDKLRFELARPGPGWKMLHRRDAAAWHPGVVAGALSPGTLVGTVSVYQSDDAAHELAEQLGPRLSADAAETLRAKEVDVAGRKGWRFTVETKAAGLALRYGGVAMAKDGYAYELLAWGPADTTPEDAFDPLIDAFKLLDGKVEPEALPQPAEKIDATDDAIGNGYALRGDTWWSFEHGLSVERPTSDWKMTASAHARAHHPHAGLVMTRGDQQAMVVVDPGGELGVEHYHREAQRTIAARLGTQPGPIRRDKLGDADARVSDGLIGGIRRARIATTLHEAYAVSLVVSSKRSLDNESIEQTSAALKLHTGLQQVEATTDLYRDNRLGFQLRPPTGWLREVVTPRELEPVGTMVRWQLEGRWVAVVATAISGGRHGQKWMVSLLEQLLRDVLAPAARASSVHQAIIFLERPAIKISWGAPLQHLAALVFSRGGVAYAVITQDHSTDAFEHAMSNFSLVP